tara:strand:+ start:153 stop:440 length:288 start_codon:yes stop_codon:yes gene_type:complete
MPKPIEPGALCLTKPSHHRANDLAASLAGKIVTVIHASATAGIPVCGCVMWAVEPKLITADGTSYRAAAECVLLRIDDFDSSLDNITEQEKETAT